MLRFSKVIMLAALLLAIAGCSIVSKEVIPDPDHQEPGGNEHIIGAISPVCYGLEPSLGPNDEPDYGRWADHLEVDQIRCVPDDGNFTGTDKIIFQMNSTNINDARLTLAIYSNNPDTASSDYYHVHFTVDWEGWKQFEYSLDDLIAVREPLGWGQIDSIMISASGWGNTPLPDTDLTISPIVFQSERDQGD